MVKLIFRTIIITVFLVFVTVALAIWKGGEPFRYFGEGVMVIGKSIVEFGDYVDGFKSGRKSLRKKYDKVKEIIKDDDEEAKDRKDK